MANVKDLYARISATADGFNKVMDGVDQKTRNVSKSITKQSSVMSRSLSGIGSAGKSLQNVGSSMQGIGNKAQDIGSKFNSSITKPAGIAAGAIGGMVGALGFKRLMGMDAAQAKLKGLGYSGKEVEGISKQVTTAIEGSMTTMAEGTDIAAGGLASGVEEGKELEKYIKLVGDAAVGSGRPVNEMSQIFARIEGSGKVMTEELNMIEDGMPGFSKAMAEDMGVPLDEFREKVSAGEVSSEQFMTTMDGFAGKMSGAYAESFEGMAKNVVAFTGQIGEKLLGGAFEKSKDSLNEFLGWISSKEVQNGAAQLGEKIGTAFNIIISSVSSAVKWFAGLPGPVHKTALAFGAVLVAIGPILTIFGKLSVMIGGLFGTFGKLLGFVSKMGPAFAVLSGPVGWIIGAIIALGAAFVIAYNKSETFRNFVNGIGDSLGKAIGWVKQFGQAIGALFGGEQKEGTSLLKKLGFNEEQIATLQEMVGRIKSMFTTMGDTLGVVFGRMGDTWNQVAQSFQEAIPFFQLAFDNLLGIVMPLLSMIGRQFKIVFDMIVGIVQGAMQMVQGVIQIFSGLIQGDFGLMWQGIKNVFMGAVQVLLSIVKGLFFMILNIIRGVGGMLGGALRAVFNTFKPIIMAVWNGIKWATIAVWNGIINAVVTSVNTLKLRVTQILNALKFVMTAIWNGIKIATVAVWNGIKWAIINVVNGIKATAVAVFNALKWAITSIWNGIKIVSVAVWNGIKWAILNAVRGIKSTAVAVFNALKFAITAIWNGIKAVSLFVWNGIKNGILSAVRIVRSTAIAIFNALKNSLTMIWNVIKNVAIATWNAIKNRVLAIVRGLRATAIAVFNAFKNSLTAIWNTMKAVASATWNWIKNRVIALARGLRATVIAVFNALKNGISAIWNAIKASTSAAWNWIKNKAIALARTLRSTVTAVFNALRSAISGIWNAIKSSTSAAWNWIKNKATSLATGLRVAVTGTFNKLKNAIAGIWNSIKGTTAKIWQGIKSSIMGFANGIKNGVTGAFDKMAGALSKTIDKIKGFVQSMVDKVKGGLNKLIDGVNWVGDKLGMDKIGHVKMHTGTSSGGSVTRNGKMSKDVMATVGDKGKGNGPGGFRHETVIPPRGKPFITPNRDTLMPASKGTKIMNGAQTHAMLSGGTHAFAKGTGWGDKIADFGKGGVEKAHGMGKDMMKKGGDIGNAAKDKTKDLVEGAKETIGKGAGWLGKKVGDVMDFVKKPGKLLEHVLKAFGVNFDGLGKDNIPADMMGGMFKKLKDAAKNKLKEWLEDAEGGEGDAGWLLKHDIWQKFGAYTGGLGFNGGQHYGVDFGMLPGTDVKAVAGGKVSKVWDDYGGGKSMEIDIGGGLTNQYMHLSKQLKKKGDQVGVGDLIAKSGNTGNFTAGSGHLHFQLNKNGKPQANVLEWLKGLGGGGKKKPSAWGSTIDKAAKKMGVKLSGGQRKGLIAQIARESNGDAGVTQSTAVNDINAQTGNLAQGLLQYVPQTFKSYATKGHTNIKSGYDQLLAFFNNSNWASDLQYGKSGWGPRGTSRGYANGGIINSPEMAWLAEGGFSESVISHDPKKRARSKALHDKTGKMLGIDDDATLLREIIDTLNAGNNLQSINNRYAKQTAGKDTNVYLSGKKMTEEINTISGSMIDGKNYNHGQQ